jgi:hypothetical protein
MKRLIYEQCNINKAVVLNLHSDRVLASYKGENYKNSKFAHVTESWGITDTEIKLQLS